MPKYPQDILKTGSDVAAFPLAYSVQVNKCCPSACTVIVGAGPGVYAATSVVCDAVFIHMRRDKYYHFM